MPDSEITETEATTSTRPLSARKQRLKEKTAARLERRLNAYGAVAEELKTDQSAEDATAPEAAVESGDSTVLTTQQAAAAAAAQKKLRHDPIFKGSTFWRDKKERRSRTLFVGGLPASVRNGVDVKDILDARLAALKVEVKPPLNPKADIDLLKTKFLRAKSRNCYVTFPNLDSAYAAVDALNDFVIELPHGSTTLRVNFAGDKQARSEAIAKRPVNYDQLAKRKAKMGRGKGAAKKQAASTK